MAVRGGSWRTLAEAAWESRLGVVSIPREGWHLCVCTYTCARRSSVERTSFQRRNFTVRGPKNDGNDEVAEWGGLLAASLLAGVPASRWA